MSLKARAQLTREVIGLNGDLHFTHVFHMTVEK